MSQPIANKFRTTLVPDSVPFLVDPSRPPECARSTKAAAAASPAVFPSTASCAAAEGRSAAEQEDADEAAAASAPTFEGGVVLEDALISAGSQLGGVFSGGRSGVRRRERGSSDASCRTRLSGLGTRRCPRVVVALHGYCAVLIVFP